ncbi:MAG TPA: DJ-1/PfpI family protein [Candidatus Binatia bacterium]|nr:DJ-1/PfpI family protein [Candidatus Binatia bacterium]
MKIAILLYDEMTALDAIGPYEVLAQAPGNEAVFVGEHRGIVRTDTGALGLSADRSIDDVSAADVLVVPGGPGDRRVRETARLLEWVRAIDATTTWTTSVCTGSLILGAAGLLRGKRATTHWCFHDELATYGATPTLERVVSDGKIVTAAGVSSGIDMGLRLLQRTGGDALAQALQLAIEYDPMPPFDAGSPAKAPAEVVALVRSVFADALARGPGGAARTAAR